MSSSSENKISVWYQFKQGLTKPLILFFFSPSIFLVNNEARTKSRLFWNDAICLHGLQSAETPLNHYRTIIDQWFTHWPVVTVKTERPWIRVRNSWMYWNYCANLPLKRRVGTSPWTQDVETDSLLKMDKPLISLQNRKCFPVAANIQPILSLTDSTSPGSQSKVPSEEWHNGVRLHPEHTVVAFFFFSLQ